MVTYTFVCHDISLCDATAIEDDIIILKSSIKVENGGIRGNF